MSVNTIKYQVIKENLDTQGGSVVSISGPWGVGKTHFWHKFMQENNKNLNLKKYGYVSLFGIESLDGLKLSIAAETSSNEFEENVWKKNVELPKWFKRITNRLNNVSSHGVSIGGGLLTNILFDQVVMAPE